MLHMPKARQISLLTVAVAAPTLVALVCLWLTADQSLWVQMLSILGVVVFTVGFSTEVLLWNLPSSLGELAENNCYRLAGDKSEKRSRREQAAVGKLRRDIWAIGILASSLWCGVIFVFHTYYVPIPVAVRVLVAFEGSAEGWSGSLRDKGLVDDVEQSTKQTYGGDRKTAAQNARLLWQAAPLVAMALVLCVVLSAVAINLGFRLALRDYQEGLLARQKSNTDRDIERLQSSSSGNQPNLA